MKYVIDPMLFALKKDFSEKEFIQFVNMVLLWDNWLELYPNDVFMLSDSENILASASCYPIYNVFNELKTKYKINHVASKDLNKAIQNIFYKSNKIDCKKMDGNFIIISTDYKCNPTDKNCKKLLWFLFCQCKANGEKPEKYVLFSKNITDDTTFKVKYQFINESIGDFVEKQEEINVYCKKSLPAFFKCDDATNIILRQAKTKNDVDLAVRVATYKNGNLKRVADCIDKKKYNFIIQKSFFSDLTATHYQTNISLQNSIMEAMSHTLLNLNMGKREDFRIDAGGNSPQKHHGEYYAWRRYVTYNTKMQYWQKENRYKFASINTHNEFKCCWEDYEDD